MSSYAAKQVRHIVAAGPAPGESFFRLKVTGNGESTWVNVSREELEAIAAVLEIKEAAKTGATR